MIRAGLFGALAALAACLSPDSQVCSGDDHVDVLCPITATCLQVGSSAVCVVCGDGKLEGGEVCDDGNTVSGDGCSADCRSLEKCGNGIVDVAVGEQCDDGNLLAHDGCDSTCAPELPHWVELTAVDLPLPGTRTAAAMTYDARHDEVVLFGGSNASVSSPASASVTTGDTWLWRGSWHQVLPFKSPAPRSQTVLAYVGVDGNSYLYGGLDAGGQPLSDLWRWTGNAWEHIDVAATAMHPGPLSAAAMAYDAHRQRLVLYGGTDPSVNSVADTWELDVTTAPPTWTKIGIGSADPGARSAHAMAYDAHNENIVMYGGEVVATAAGADNTVVAAVADTWTYDATGWHGQPSGSVKPPPGAGHTLGFDGTQIVLGTGTGTFTWDGAWHSTAATGARAAASVAFVPPDQLLQFSGGIFVEETALWPAGGAPHVGSGGPDFVGVSSPDVVRSAEGAVLDLSLGEPIMFGGLVPPGPSQGPLPGNDGTGVLMSMTNGTWAELTTTGTLPASRAGLAAAFDESQLETIFFGGHLVNAQDDAAETWSWKHGRSPEWREEQSVGPPTGRIDHAMTYDASRKRVIVFGGLGNGSALDDTWEWNGSEEPGMWTQGASGPPARFGAALAYDRAHQEVVLFGGKTALDAAGTLDPSSMLLADTWVLTAAGWTQKDTTAGGTRPSPRVGAAMAWNPMRQRVVLFGGQSTISEQDTWEWDGTAWREIPTLPPPPRAGGVLLGARDGVMLFGGTPTYDATSGQRGDVWLLRYDGSHASENCRDASDDDGDGKSGCADPDCWLECTPLCMPGDDCTSVASSPACGDGVCGLNETDELCPDDCKISVCGDGRCSLTDCPGDCP